jgi:hypothetical protein
MKVVKKKLADLKHPEKNLRLHTDKQLVEFKRSIEMFGQIRPIVVDENNVMLAGNGLHEALLQLGRTEADCYIVTELSEQQKKKLMLADNRIFDLGVDDMAAFDEFILDLKDDLDIPGFDEDMLKSFIMDTKEADDLLAGYGTVSPEQAEGIRETQARYEERDAADAAKAEQLTPGSVPEEVREAAGYAENYQSEEPERRFILCPKCGERIWL